MKSLKSLSEKIESRKARRDEALLAGRLAEAKGWEARVAEAIAERDAYAAEIYERFGYDHAA